MTDDDRIESAFVYHATGPGRWSSAGGVNLGNMPRPRACYDDADLDAATLFKAFRTEEPQVLRELYGPVLGLPLNLVSDAIRSFIWAAPGHDFIAVDYSGIQGAIGAWLGDEEWKLQAMREILTDPTLPDMYRRAAAGILNTTTEIITKKHPMRQACGKTSELSLLFSGGVVALVKMAKNYGMKLRDFHDLYPVIAAAATEEIREKVIKRHERATKSRDKVMSDIMSREAWMACDLIKFGWRAKNPAQTAAWETLEDATLEAMRNPGKRVDSLKVSYLYARGALWCRLLSGRCICYNAPRLRDQVWAKIKLLDGSWTEESEVMDREEAQALERKGEAKIEGATRQRLTSLHVDPQTHKLVRRGLYGGKHMQNLCLGIESDILRAGMLNLEAAGYEIRLHNYDEAVAQVPRGWGSVAEAERLMLDLPEQYATLPLGAHGFRSKRYAKK
jgi:DNA polymerase